jgi:small ligand-binding sensory domain FIST
MQSTCYARRMRWASALSTQAETGAALSEVTAAVRRDLEGARADLLLTFVSAHHATRYELVLSALREAFPEARVAGCSGAGVIGAGHEAEAGPALSLTAAWLPGVELAIAQGDDALDFGTLSDDPHFVVLVDPFTCDAEGLLGSLDEAFPKSSKVGGLASGGRFPGENALFCDQKVYRGGAVVVALGGDLAVDTIVAQGCRPIGRPMVVTRAEENLIQELDQRKPSEVLHELYEALSERDQQLFRNSLFVGIEMRSQQVEVRAGEFLVRNLVGMDKETGALAVGAAIQPWQVVQLFLRDARTAEEDLKRHLEHYASRGRRERPAGALLFSCVGRGENLFGKADHDTNLFRDRVGPVPLGGFFCAGEIGPVGVSTFLHGYTSAFALFRPRG